MELSQRIAIFNRYSVNQVATAESPGGAALTAARMRSVAEAAIEQGVEAGREMLQPFAVSPLGPVKLRAPGSSTKLNAQEQRDAEVLIRDEFKCRYCDGDLIMRAVHELFATILPQQYPYHSNGKIGYYHPAQWWLEYACDHVVPRSRGGTNDIQNRVAACWWHNDPSGISVRRDSCRTPSHRRHRPPLVSRTSTRPCGERPVSPSRSVTSDTLSTGRPTGPKGARNERQLAAARQTDRCLPGLSGCLSDVVGTGVGRLAVAEFADPDGRPVSASSGSIASPPAATRGSTVADDRHPLSTAEARSLWPLDPASGSHRPCQLS